MSKTLIILIALVGGILLGVVAGTRFVDVADVIGTLWLNGLRMTVVPLVVALLITGIAQTADAARAGRLAGRAVLTMLAILWSSSLLAAVMIPTLLTLFPMPEGAADALKLAHRPAGETEFDISIIDDTDPIGNGGAFYPSITLDPTGNPVVAYGVRQAATVAGARSLALPAAQKITARSTALT